MTTHRADTGRPVEDWAERLDLELQHWERLRRRLLEREAHWAVTVMATADRRRLASMRRELAELKAALDEVFGRAMGFLDLAVPRPRSEVSPRP